MQYRKDKYGNEVKTSTVYLRQAASITTQPKTTYTKLNGTAKVTVKASGDGLKWIININTAEVSHEEYFNAVANYLRQTYGLEADKSGKDVSRACFLPYDPEAYINPKNL